MFSLIPVILCGGSGSRLWPVSREQHPKPFMTLPDGESLIQKALLRAQSCVNVMEIITVTNRELLFKAVDAFADINQKTEIPLSYILEPVARNTAAAIASAALLTQHKHGDEAILLILAADHLIKDQLGFAKAVDMATTLAQSARLVTFGIPPQKPETGYGYIKFHGTDVECFVEKPDYDHAVKYIASGNYLWNAGIFCFSCHTLLQEMQQLCPQILNTVQQCLTLSRKLEANGATQIDLDRTTFARVEDISIDYAVMEKSRRVSVIPCNIGWCDIGSWSTLSDLLNPDNNGNTIDSNADVLIHNTSNCYIKSEERIVGAVGVENLIIVDTTDAVLVANKACTQDVKSIYNQLKSMGNTEYKTHRTRQHPFGSITVIEQGFNFKIHRIVIKPGKSLCLQRHSHRSEQWIVVNGLANIHHGCQDTFLSASQSIHIAANEQIQVANPGLIDLILITVQSGEYLEEDYLAPLENEDSNVSL